LYGELGYNKNEVVRFNLRGDYYSYSTDKEPEAWHRPTYRLTSSASFNVYQKLLLNIGLVGQGGMKALNNETAQVVELDPGIDLNVKADYFLSKQVSIFLKFENILSNDYPVYLNYPVRGFQAMGGVSWSF
jgi:outer membrane cobalamin receptor